MCRAHTVYAQEDVAVGYDAITAGVGWVVRSGTTHVDKLSDRNDEDY